MNNPSVLVVGDGLLADFVTAELALRCKVTRHQDLPSHVPAGIDFGLLLHDGCQPSLYPEAEIIFRMAHIPWLRGFVTLGEAVIGPLVHPDTPGCSTCADRRKWMASSDRLEMWELQKAVGTNGGIARDVWASRTGLLQVAHRVMAEMEHVFRDGGTLGGRLYLLNLKTLRGTLHSFLPEPSCGVCGDVPEDSRDSVVVKLIPNPKLRPDSYRVRKVEELSERLSADYLDYRTGLLNGKMADLTSAFAAVSVNLPMVQGDEPTAGRTLSYHDSELTAILEGLERYCGLSPRGKQTVVHDTYRNLRVDALNPSRVGLHAKEQYARSDFPFRPYDENGPMDWVWGYSMSQERPILVPELLAYYSLGCRPGFVYETSNGCALGGSMVEAIFHGILEVVERDAFLMTWYAQLPLPRLNPYSSSDTELRLMLNRLEAATGYEVHLFNATMENDIPTVWALAKNRKPTGINLVCAAGAHVDPVRATKGAIHELAGMLLVLDEKFEKNKEQCWRMYHNPYEVRHMEDHSMLYSLPEAEERFDFLLRGNQRHQTFDEAFKPWPRHADLTEDLRGLLAAFRRLNLEVIVVDQTAPELKKNGLCCVKVLIPGMLPMTFGYHLTRLEGMDRVLTVPMRLGYTTQPLTRHELNPHPHPFP